MNLNQKRQWASIMPLLIFLALVAALAGSMFWKQDSTGPDRLLGKTFQIERLLALPPVTAENGQVVQQAASKRVLVNVFASWCAPCVDEIPELEQLKQQGLPILGLAWKDEPERLQRWLEKFGNPYHAVRLLNDSSLVIELGMTGVPETLLLENGQVIWHVAGPLEEPQLTELNAILERQTNP